MDEKPVVVKMRGGELTLKCPTCGRTAHGGIFYARMMETNERCDTPDQCSNELCPFWEMLGQLRYDGIEEEMEDDNLKHWAKNAILCPAMGVL